MSSCRATNAKPRRKCVLVPTKSDEQLQELREGARLAGDLPLATFLRVAGIRETRRLKAANGGER